VTYSALEQLQPRSGVVYRVQARAGQPGPQRVQVTLRSPDQPDGVRSEADTQVLPGPQPLAPR
jgi:hypothetical protein